MEKFGYAVMRRKFTARHFPKGSTQRIKLNDDILTSEYGPGSPYAVVSDDGKFSSSFRTKKKALEFLKSMYDKRIN